MPLTIEEMKEAVAKARIEAQKSVAEKKERRQLELELHKLTDEKMLDNEANQQVLSENTEKLKILEATLAEIVADTPLYNVRTKENRKWSPNRNYKYGNQVTIIMAILNGIQYAAAIHKEQMLAVTGLGEDLIEDTLNSFGNPAYFNENTGLFVEEEPYDLDRFLANLSLVEQALNVTVNRSKLTETKFATVFKSSRLDALELQSKKELTAKQEEAAISLTD